MTTTNLRLKYKQETGESPTNEYNTNYRQSKPKNASNWLTDEYCEWLERKFSELVDQIEEIS